MSALIGMDVDQVQQLSKDLRSQAERIEDVSLRIDDLIQRMGGIWRGTDAEQFADWWSSQHRPAVRAVHDAIEGLAQSAANNADDQARASGGWAATPGPGSSSNGMAGISIAGPEQVDDSGSAGGVAPGQVGSASGSLPGSGRTWQEVDAAYRADSARLNVPVSYRAGHDYEYQCTAWAMFRWRELGFTGDIGTGNGGQMASNNGGTTTTPPTLGAMASYGSGYGHVMIVEEVSGDGNSVRVSEMNAGDKQLAGHPNEYRSDEILVRQENGTWAYQNGRGNVGAITFANLPK